MESINVQVDDYLPSSSYSKLEDPLVGSILEEGNTLNTLKDPLASNDRDSDLVFTYVHITPEIEHLVIKNVRNIEDQHQHLDDQDNVEFIDVQAHKPSRKIQKNHHAFNIVGYP